MRVSIVIHPSAAKPVGGYLVAYTYANQLASRGHQVTITHAWVHEPPNWRLARQYAHNLAHQAVRRPPVAPWFTFHPSVELRSRPLLSRHLLPSADVTIFTAWQTVESAGLLQPRHGKLMQIVFDYEYWRSATGDSKERMRAAFCRPDIERIATSQAVQTMLVEMGSSWDHHIACGIDHNLWRIDREPEERQLVVGFPARSERHKGMEDADGAAELIAAKTGAEVISFGALSESASVHSRGYLSNTDLRAFYNECAVFFLPSHYEGWGLPAAEAMACGAAVVSTKNGGTEDFALSEQTALLVPTRRPDLLADAVCRLLRDRSLRLRLARAGSDRVAEMSWDVAGDALIEAFVA